MSFNFFTCFVSRQAILMAKFHKDFVMNSRDTGPLLNLGPFGPIVTSTTSYIVKHTEESYTLSIT